MATVIVASARLTASKWTICVVRYIVPQFLKKSLGRLSKAHVTAGPG